MTHTLSSMPLAANTTIITDALHGRAGVSGATDATRTTLREDPGHGQAGGLGKVGVVGMDRV